MKSSRTGVYFLGSLSFLWCGLLIQFSYLCIQMLPFPFKSFQKLMYLEGFLQFKLSDLFNFK